MIKGTVWLCSDLANVATAKYYLLRGFPENLKQLSLFVCLFVLFDSLRPINNLSVKTGTGLPGLNQY